MISSSNHFPAQGIFYFYFMDEYKSIVYIVIFSLSTSKCILSNIGSTPCALVCVYMCAVCNTRELMPMTAIRGCQMSDFPSVFVLPLRLVLLCNLKFMTFYFGLFSVFLARLAVSKLQRSSCTPLTELHTQRWGSSHT